jgi:dTDP-4-dehydrorhamnose reductase
MKRKILITGESGLLSTAIKRYIPSVDNKFEIINTETKATFCNIFHTHNNRFVKSKELDICNREALLDIELTENDIVIHTAAYVNTDKCNTFTYDAIKSNILGTQNVIDLCLKTRAKLIYMSTTAVFDPESYMKNSGYFTEESRIDPKTIYGLTKYIGEKCVKQSLENWIVIKPVFIYGDAPIDNSSNIRKIFEAVIDKKNIIITLNRKYKKNYMRSEGFALMFNRILENSQGINKEDFIISRDKECAREFSYYIELMSKIAEVDIMKYVTLKEEDDYLADHIGISKNFYKHFPDFKLPHEIFDDYSSLKKTYDSVAKLKNEVQ